jgi:hypothetical protein
MEISLKDPLELAGGKNTTERNPLDAYMGKAVFIRTVTHHYTGRVVELIGSNVVRLTEAAWIADDGLFSAALAEGKLNEVEPYQDDVLVFLNATIDVTEWKHKLPRERK